MNNSSYSRNRQNTGGRNNNRTNSSYQQSNYNGAPYNFIPLPQMVYYRYDNVSSLPSHAGLDPNLYTGEIHLELTAQTPVYIGNGQRDRYAKFVMNANGRYYIPGSSLRGLTRTNMQILGQGEIRARGEVADTRFMYRMIYARSDSVKQPLQQSYMSVVTQLNEDRISLPVARPGFVVRRGRNYYIYPAECFYAISRRDVAREFDTEDARLDATQRECWYEPIGEGRAIISGSEKPGYKKGVLLCTGRAVNNAGNRRYIFPIVDTSNSACAIEIPAADVLTYKMDYKLRQNALRGGSSRSWFWALPKEGDEPMAVFYLEHDGHVYFGRTRMPRIAFLKSVGNGIPAYRNAITANGEQRIDYPNAILGFCTVTMAYRSRVSFGDCEVVDGGRETDARHVVLGQPKASFFLGYLTGENSNEVRHYNDMSFRIRGIKQYWLHAVNVRNERNERNGNDNVGSELKPLATGTRFKGVVRFRNLAKDELGLLLWCLRLDENCYQTVGMGKPYGFGRMSVSVESLRLYEFRSLYSMDSLESMPGDISEDATSRVNEFIEEYTKSHAKYLCVKPRGSTPLRQIGPIADFLFMHSSERTNEETRYMTLGEYLNISAPLPTVSDIRNAADAEQPKSEEEILSAFTAKFAPQHGRRKK